MTTLNIRIDREDKLRAESIQWGGPWSPILLPEIKSEE